MELVFNDVQTESALYEPHYTFTAAKYDEITWQRLLPGSLEGYRYHLAFELGKISGFKTGYISLSKGGAIVCIAPIFVMDYIPGATSPGFMGTLTQRIGKWIPDLLAVRLLCVGSAVTDSAQIGFFKDQPLDSEMVKALSKKLDDVAEREGAKLIAFKDLASADAKKLQPTLCLDGYASIENMPIGKKSIQYKSLEEYLATLSEDARHEVRRKLEILNQMHIEEHNGQPPNLEEIYQLYLNYYEKSELKLEKLTLEFFESLAGLMPDQSRFVLYYTENKLVGFNCLLYGNGVLMDKYIGMDDEWGTPANLHSLSWIYNIQMCIRDGFHTFQSRHINSESKIDSGSVLEKTHILFKPHQDFVNPFLKLASSMNNFGNCELA